MPETAGEEIAFEPLTAIRQEQTGEQYDRVYAEWKTVAKGTGVHNPINKKCPTLVCYIPCGREAVVVSIGCKGTAFFRGHQMFWQKRA